MTATPAKTLSELRQIAEAVAAHEPDFTNIHEYLDALRIMQEALSGTVVLNLISRLERAEQQEAKVRELASEYRKTMPEEVLHSVMQDIITTLDGTHRG